MYPSLGSHWRISYSEVVDTLFILEDSADEVEKLPDLMVTSARLSKEVFKVQRPQPL